MRRTLTAYRSNPIEPDAAAELVEYTKKNGGFLRVSFRSKDASKMEMLLRPDQIVEREKVRYLVGRDIRSVTGEPTRKDSAERVSINLQNMFTMAYRPEKDVDAIVTDAGGTFRFLNMRFPLRLEYGDKVFNSAYEALVDVAGGPKTKKEAERKKTLDVEIKDLAPGWLREDGEASEAAAKVMAAILRAKFSNGTMQRWLMATGERPLALPEFLSVDYNDTLETLREEALRGGVQPSITLPARPTLSRSAVLGTEETAGAVEEAQGYLKALAAQRSAFAEAGRGPDSPTIVIVDPYGLRHGTERDYDAMVYVRAYERQNMDKVPSMMAMATPPIPHIIIDEPKNIEDEDGIRIALKWLLEHPYWKRIAIAAASYNPKSPLISNQTLDYFALLEAGLIDPALRADVNKDIYYRYTDTGDIISPVSGTVTGIQRTAAAHRIGLKQKFTLKERSRNMAKYTLNAFRDLATTMDSLMSDLRRDQKPLRDIEAAAQRVQDELVRSRASQREIEAASTQVGGTVQATTLVRQRERLFEDIQNLVGEVTSEVQKAEKKLHDPSVEYTPIEAAGQDYAELRKAKDALSIAADLVGQYAQLLKRAVAAASALSPKALGMTAIAEKFHSRLYAPHSGVVAYYEDLKRRIDHATKNLQSMPKGLTSESRSENLKALAQLYPGPTRETQYQFRGDELYRYDFFDLPLNTPPLNVKSGDQISIGSIIEVGGRRTDLPKTKKEQYAVDKIILINQDEPINCAPVTLEVLDIGETLTDRSVIAETVNNVLEEKLDELRMKTVKAKVLAANKDEAAAELQRLSDKMGPGNYIEKCSRFDFTTGENVAVDAKFVEDPVFYVLLVGPTDIYRLHEGRLAPSEPSARHAFMQVVGEEYGENAVAYYSAPGRKFMTDLPMDEARIPLMWPLSGFAAAAVRKVLPLLQAPGSVDLVQALDSLERMGRTQYAVEYLNYLLRLRYRSSNPFEPKEMRETRKAAQKQVTQAEVGQRYLSLGVQGAGGSGIGKVYIGKPGKPGSAPEIAGGLGTVGAMQAGRYDPGTGGTMVLTTGRGSAPKQVGSAYVVGKGDRFQQYMDQMIELRKLFYPTQGEEAKAQRKSEYMAKMADQTGRAAVSSLEAGVDPLELYTPQKENPYGARMRRTLRNTNGDEPPAPPPRRRVRLSDAPVGAEEAKPEIRIPSVAPSAAPKSAATTAAASPFAEAAAPEIEGVSFAGAQDPAVLRGRADTARTWKAFVTALRARGAEKESKSELIQLQRAYAAALAELEVALDTRDRAILRRPGGDLALRALLRDEAAAYMRQVPVVYTRPPRGENVKTSETQRLRTAAFDAESVDAFGRPLAPPSESELAAAGLTPLDLSTARVLNTELSPAARARSMPAAMNYDELKKAAAIAAAAEKKKIGGVSTSSVSCRVMTPERRVAHKLMGAEPLHQLIFGRMGESKEVQQFKTVILWVAPYDNHVIFYVNGIPTCEFHNDTSFVDLLADLLRYTEDWFNDPREMERRRDYRVLIGKSGCPFMYQIWGPLAARAGAGYRRDVGPFVAEIAMEKVIQYGLLGGEDEFVCVKDAPSGVMKSWITDAVAQRFQTTAAEVLEAEKAAYLRAAGERIGRAGVAGTSPADRLRSIAPAQAANEVLLATNLPANHFTLYYPKLYVEDGILSQTLNDTTGEDLKRQLDGLVNYAKSHPRTKFTIVDSSLFSDSVIRDALASFEKFEDDLYFRQPDPGEQLPDGRALTSPRTVPPFMYLRRKLLDKNIPAEIEVRYRLSSGLKNDELFNELAALYEQDPKVPVRLRPTEGRGSFDTLTKDFESGSTLVLWNDPDFKESDEYFGRRDGLREVAEFLSSKLGHFRAIDVESEGFLQPVVVEVMTRGVPAKARLLLTPPERLRQELLNLLTASIAASQSTGRPLEVTLGLPAAIVTRALTLAQGSTQPRALAEATLAAIAEAYKIKPDEYFRYGWRLRNPEGVAENPRSNRLRTSRLLASRMMTQPYGRR